MRHGIAQSFQEVDTLLDHRKPGKAFFRQVLLLRAPLLPLLRPEPEADHSPRKGFPLPDKGRRLRIRVFPVKCHNPGTSPILLGIVTGFFLEFNRTDLQRRCKLTDVLCIFFAHEQTDLLFFHEKILQHFKLIPLHHLFTSCLLLPLPLCGLRSSSAALLRTALFIHCFFTDCSLRSFPHITYIICRIA